MMAVLPLSFSPTRTFVAGPKSRLRLASLSPSFYGAAPKIRKFSAYRQARYTGIPRAMRPAASTTQAVVTASSAPPACGSDASYDSPRHWCLV